MGTKLSFENKLAWWIFGILCFAIGASVITRWHPAPVALAAHSIAALIGVFIAKWDLSSKEDNDSDLPKVRNRTPEPPTTYDPTRWTGRP